MSTLREFYRPWKLTHLALVRERLARGTRCIACPHFISEWDEGTVIYLMGETPPRRLPKRRHIGVACQDCIEHALTYHGAGDLPRGLPNLFKISAEISRRKAARLRDLATFPMQVIERREAQAQP